jgi:hypothetical protein
MTTSARRAAAANQYKRNCEGRSHTGHLASPAIGLPRDPSCAQVVPFPRGGWFSTHDRLAVRDPAGALDVRLDRPPSRSAGRSVSVRPPAVNGCARVSEARPYRYPGRFTTTRRGASGKCDPGPAYASGWHWFDCFDHLGPLQSRSRGQSSRSIGVAGVPSIWGASAR